MFQLPLSPRTAGPKKPDPVSLFKRAGWLALALVMLWLALQFTSGRERDPGHLYSDASGTVATKPAEVLQAQRDESLVRPGYILAMLLLAGGGAFAVYLRKRNPGPAASSPSISLLGKVQITPAQHLRLVACGGEVLLLGVTSSQITLLTSFPASEFGEAPAAGPENHLGAQPSAPALPHMGGFAEILSRLNSQAAAPRFEEKPS